MALPSWKHLAVSYTILGTVIGIFVATAFGKKKQ